MFSPCLIQPALAAARSRLPRVRPSSAVPAENYRPSAVVVAPARSAAGDSDVADRARWFVEEVHPHGSQLRAYLKNAYPMVGDVDDVVQESYLRLWKARAVQPIESARGFLFEVARRLAIDLARRGRRSPIDQQVDVSRLRIQDGGPGVFETVSRNEKILLLADAIESLPGKCRAIFVLRRLKGVPQKEVAARLGLSERTVEVQVSRGLRRCEDYLRQRGVSGFFHDETP